MREDKQTRKHEENEKRRQESKKNTHKVSRGVADNGKEEKGKRQERRP